MQNPLRLAIVGCGAVVEQFHLPAAQRVPEVQVVALADPDLEHAAALARRFGVPRVAADYREVLPEAEALPACVSESAVTVGGPVVVAPSVMSVPEMPR